MMGNYGGINILVVLLYYGWLEIQRNILSKITNTEVDDRINEIIYMLCID